MYVDIVRIYRLGPDSFRVVLYEDHRYEERTLDVSGEQLRYFREFCLASENANLAYVDNDAHVQVALDESAVRRSWNQWQPVIEEACKTPFDQPVELRRPGD